MNHVAPSRSATIAALAQRPHRRFVAGGAAVLRLEERPFAEPDVELDAQGFEVGADQIEHEGETRLAQPLGRFSRVAATDESFELLTVGCVAENAARRVGHVVAGVAVGGQGCVHAQRLRGAGVERGVEVVHLVAGVVDVILTHHVETGGGEDVGQCTAQHRAPGVPHVDRARRVDAHELDLDLAARADGTVGVDLALLQHRLHLAGQPALGEFEVDEAGPDRRGLSDLVEGCQRAGDALGDFQWVHPRLPRQLHGEVRRVVTVLRVLGALDVALGQRPLRERAGLHRRRRRALRGEPHLLSNPFHEGLLYRLVCRRRHASPWAASRPRHQRRVASPRARCSGASR